MWNREFQDFLKSTFKCLFGKKFRQALRVHKHYIQDFFYLEILLALSLVVLLLTDSTVFI